MEATTFYKGNSKINIGRFTYGARGITFREWGEGAGFSIGSFCSIADNVTVYLGGNHRQDWISTFPFGHVFPDEIKVPKSEGHPGTKGSVIIGNDVWIGSGVTILSGVEIGDGAIIGANATISSDVMPYEIHVGNPGRRVKTRFDSVTIELLKRLQWWELAVPEIEEIAKYLSRTPDILVLQELITKYRPRIN